MTPATSPVKSTTAAKILLVEDEQSIRELIALHLLRQGYAITECENAEQAQAAQKNQKFDLMIVDWMLPGMSGVDFINSFKSDSSVLMITAKSEPQDIIEGLEKGADDYLTKPFDPSIMLARVKALLRRAEYRQEVKPAANSDKDFLSLNGLKLNLNSLEVRLNDQDLHLTPSEFKLLQSLIENQGRVLTRDQLIDQIQGESVNVTGRTIDTHVFGLRKKLNEWGDSIETIRGVGYRVKNI